MITQLIWTIGPRCLLSPERLLNLITHSPLLYHSQLSPKHNRQTSYSLSSWMGELWGVFWVFNLINVVPQSMQFYMQHLIILDKLLGGPGCIWICEELPVYHYIDGVVQERRNSIAGALELRLSCANPSSCWLLWPLEDVAVIPKV